MPQKDVESCALCAKIQAFQPICVLSVTLTLLVGRAIGHRWRMLACHVAAISGNCAS